MLTFLVADLITGRIREEIPASIKQALTRFLMDVGAGELSIPVLDPACPPDWEDLTKPWRSLFIASDTGSGRILWAGIPVGRQRDPVTGTVELSLVTAEGYLARRYVPSLSFSRSDQTSGIAARLARIANDGHGINLDFDTPSSGVRRDRDYYDDESGRVLERLQQLGNVVDGFEWTIDVEWTDHTQTAVRKVFRTGYPTIGVEDENPNAIFEMPGSIAQALLEERWGESDVATHVTAVGDGEGESRLMSAPVIDHVAEASGIPRLELRRAYSSVTTSNVINSHAGSLAGRVFGGQELVTFSARTDAEPELDKWDLGDSVGVAINTDTVNLNEVWRVVGWSLSGNLTQITPTLARIGETPEPEGS